MLKILEITESTTRFGKGEVGVSSDSRARRDGRCKFDKSEIGNSEIDSNEVKNNKVIKKSQKIL